MTEKCGKDEIYYHAPVNRCVPKNRPFIGEIVIEHIPDENPDLSFLEEMKGKDKKWAEHDTKRLANYGNDWAMMGIKVKAEIYIPKKSTPPSWQIQEISSGGLWGIETDSGDDYINGIEKEEMEDLIDNLKYFKISKKEIKKAPIRYKR